MLPKRRAGLGLLIAPQPSNRYDVFRSRRVESIVANTLNRFQAL